MNVEKPHDQNDSDTKPGLSESASSTHGQVDGQSDDLQPLKSLNSQSPQLPKIISFSSLARCGDEIWIENNGQIYRLRKTKQDKLILTK